MDLLALRCLTLVASLQELNKLDSGQRIAVLAEVITLVELLAEVLLEPEGCPPSLN